MKLINYKVNIDGFSFHLKEFGEASNATDWLPFLEKTEDLAPYQLLTQLIDDGIAVRAGNEILLSHISISDLPDDERYLLDSLGFDWNPNKTDWEIVFSHLKEFENNVGHVKFHFSFVNDSRYNLGTWTVRQRGLKRQNTLDPEQISKLEKLGFD